MLPPSKPQANGTKASVVIHKLVSSHHYQLFHLLGQLLAVALVLPIITTIGLAARNEIFGSDQGPPGSLNNYRLNFADSKLSLAVSLNGEGQTNDYFSHRHQHDQQQQYPHNTDYEASTSDQGNNNNNNNHYDSSSSLFDHDDTISTSSKNNNNYYNNYSYADQRPKTAIDDTSLMPVPGEGQQEFRDYLDHHVAYKACRLDRGCQRKDSLNNTYLRYCSRYKLESLFSNEILMSIMHDSSSECQKILDEFFQLDELINQFDSLFKNLLTRYNCLNNYSVKWSCEDCKKAYKDWLCATNLPYYMNGEHVKPCISFCERVEQRCPYLHPITKEQYGGQPVFICRDPNIPFVPEITPDIPYSEPSKCYDLCHLSDNKTELVNDSLSKYDYGKCPNKSLIAEEVRSDPHYCKLDQQQLPNKTSVSTALESEQYDSTVTTETPYYSGEETKKPNTETEVDFPSGKTPSPATPHYTSKPQETTTTSQTLHVHLKKLHELREVLTIYKSQPKTHGFGHHSDHSSSSSPSGTHHAEAIHSYS